MSELLYKKRAGTSGVAGQLYETKLLSLILYRAFHDDDVEEFYLGTNVDGLGVFDDICFRVKLRQTDRPLVVFLQAKHREDQNKTFVINDADLVKFYDSYLDIRSKFNSSDALFSGRYEDVECVFAFYTTTKDKLSKTYDEKFDKVNELFSTGSNGALLGCENTTCLNVRALQESIKQLAKLLAYHIKKGGNHYTMLMADELMQTYHVLLAQKAIDVTDAELDGYRLGKFREDFINTTDENLLLLRNTIFEELLENITMAKNEILWKLSILFAAASPYAVSTLIGRVIKYNSKHQKLEFSSKELSKDTVLAEKLANVAVTPSMVTEAIEMACKHTYEDNKPFKLPPAFGNLDLCLRGNDEKIEKRLNHLTTKIKELLERSIRDQDQSFLVTIDDTCHKGLLQLNGGMASAVGNLLVSDDETKLLKFATDSNLTGLAERLFNKMNSAVRDLDKYRLDVKVKTFPKLTFDCKGDSSVTDFMNRFMLFANQAKEHKVEDILKDEIAKGPNCTQVKTDAIFAIYHDEVHKWWLTRDPEKIKYLTKNCDLFQKASECVINNKQLNILSSLSSRNIREIGVRLRANVVNLLKVDNVASGTVLITTESIILSVAKVVQFFDGRDCIVLDLNYIQDLSADDCNQLQVELNYKSSDTVFVLMCSHFDSPRFHRGAKSIVTTLQQKNLIIVTDSADDARDHFTNIVTELSDDKIDLLDMTDESQQKLHDMTVTFQGFEVKLSTLLLDKTSGELIKGKLLNKMLIGERIAISAPLIDPKYEEIKSFYVSRDVHKATNSATPATTKDHTYHIDKVYDIPELSVAITAPPGMGKSCLLSHVALRTKEYNPTVWIVRLNLLDHSGYFFKWQELGTDVDNLEALKFVCNALVQHKDRQSQINLIKSGNKVCVDDNCVGEEVLLEIRMFLQFYEKQNVIFLFDGFDEICPHYESLVIKFLKVLKIHNSLKFRIWITSRGYNNIQHKLAEEFEIYTLKEMSFINQRIFLEGFLRKYLNLNDLSHEQLEKINSFIKFIDRTHSWQANEEFAILYKCRSLPLHNVYLDAVHYFQNEIRSVKYLKNKDKYLKSWNINIIAIKIVRQYNGGQNDINDMYEFIGTPLHLYMVADYFQSEIKNTKTNTTWNLNVSTVMMYERFLEMKLKKIRFEDKNKMDLHKSDVKFTFEKERKEFIETHKKLAAYAIFSHADELFNAQEIREIKNTIETIKFGVEKTGIIDVIIDGKPKFVHLTFAEHFAAEYIADILKSDPTHEKQYRIWNFVINKCFVLNNVGILNVLDDKIVMDKDLKRAVEKDSSKKIIFKLLHQQKIEVLIRDSHGILQPTIISALHRAMSNNLHNFLMLFLSTFDYNESNIDDLIRLCAVTNLLRDARILKKYEFIETVQKIVKKINKSKVKNLLL